MKKSTIEEEIAVDAFALLYENSDDNKEITGTVSEILQLSDNTSKFDSLDEARRTKDSSIKTNEEGIDDILIKYSYKDWHITSQEPIEKIDYDSQEKVVFFRNVFTTRIPLSVDYYDAEEICWKYIKQVFMNETHFILSAFTDAIMSNKSENKRQAVLDLKLLNKGFRNKCYQFVLYTTAWVQDDEKYSFSKLKALAKMEKAADEKLLAKRRV